MKIKEHKIHGGSKDRLYGVWRKMKARCYDESQKGYENYGGRGITVCAEWIHDYTEFKKWAMSNGYDEKAERGEYTLDRIDVNKGYAPDNCRFINMKEQANNRNNNTIIEFDGKKQTISQWADELGIKLVTLQARYQRGWSTEKMLTTAVHKKNKKYLFNDEILTLEEISERQGIPLQILKSRMYKGWDINDAVSKPVRFYGVRKITFNGETRTVKEWSEVTGISASTLYKKLSNPELSIEEILTKSFTKNMRND